MGESPGVGSSAPGNVILLPLHHRPDLTASCAELLNQTWRRSLGARIHALERSSDDFPVCLVLIGAKDGPILGHARLCRVIGLSDSLFVESVVVSSDLRGKGYGRRLMEATERYARGRGFRNLYLTTHDKQDFYYHLGYRLTEPVQNMGTLGSLLPPGMFQKMSLSKTSATSNHHGGTSSSQGIPPCSSLPECSGVEPSENPPETLEPPSRAVSIPPPCPPSIPQPPPPCPMSTPISPLPPPPPPPCPTSTPISPPPHCPTSTPYSPPPPPCPLFTPMSLPPPCPSFTPITPYPPPPSPCSTSSPISPPPHCPTSTPPSPLPPPCLSFTPITPPPPPPPPCPTSTPISPPPHCPTSTPPLPPPPPCPSFTPISPPPPSTPPSLHPPPPPPPCRTHTPLFPHPPPPPPPPCPGPSPTTPTPYPLLSSSPFSPPPPPAAPFLPSGTSSSYPQAKASSALQTPYRDLRGNPLFWMMKSI